MLVLTNFVQVLTALTNFVLVLTAHTYHSCDVLVPNITPQTQKGPKKEKRTIKRP